MSGSVPLCPTPLGPLLQVPQAAVTEAWPFRDLASTSLLVAYFSHAVTHSSMASTRISSGMSVCWKEQTSKRN